jgi:L-iditol 2-dehydrogenase
MNDSMKVAMYYNNNDVRIEQQKIPEINDDEILVKIMASGICGSDVMEWYRIKKAPLVLGHEIAGIVEKTGENIINFQKGDRVFVTHHVPCNTCRYCLNDDHTICHTLHTTKFYPGGFAEYLRVPSINVDRGTFKIPDLMTYEDATFIEPLACVVRGFRKADFKPGKSVLVLGSGVAGLLNIKLAKAHDAKKIFATDINESRLKKAKESGADFTINAKTDLPKFIKEHNNGKLADFVVLCTGVPSAVQQAINSIEPGGTLLLFAPTKPDEIIPIKLFDIWNKQIKIISTYAGAGKDITDAIDLINSKTVSVSDLITHKLNLTDAQKGFQLVAKAENSIKTILYPHEK